MDEEEEEGIFYKCPKHLHLPAFLNSNWKWNYEVFNASDMMKYTELVNKFSRVHMPTNIKKEILILLTQDIVDANRFHSPYWKILYSSHFFK